MNRLTALTAGAALLFATGCKTDGEWSVRKALGWDEQPLPGRVVALPSTKDLPRADPAISERVELLGRKLVAQNTFSGIEPLFLTVGMPETVLFHRGEELLISDGLVKLCRSDAELAAVLCSELGQMVAEKRTAKALGREVEPIRDATHGAGPFPGGTAFDAGRTAEIGFHEKQHPRGAARPDPIDSARTSRDLLVGAGYSPAELDRVEPMLKQSKRGELLKAQMGGSAPAPDWKR